MKFSGLAGFEKNPSSLWRKQLRVFYVLSRQRSVIMKFKLDQNPFSSISNISRVFLFVFTIFCTEISSANTGEVFVRFSASDYGTLNETLDSYFMIGVEKIGSTSISFSVIIELDEAQIDTNDFLSNSWTMFFPGSSEESDIQTTAVFVLDDDLPEDNETFTFRLKVATGIVTVLNPNAATVTIPANDDANGIISLQSNSTITSMESPEKDESITLTLQRDRGTFGDVVVSYKIEAITDDVENSQEEPNSDIVDDLYPATGEVIFADGEDTKDFEIFVRDDKIPENDERFLLTLISVDQGEIKDSNQSVEIKIEGNDSPLRFLHLTESVIEEDGVAFVVVVRGMDETGTKQIGPDTGDVVVNYIVTADTAAEGDDYHTAYYNVQNPGIVRFSSGSHNATIKVIIIDDDIPEIAENFTIHLLPDSVIGDAIIMSPDTCVVTIETNDKANGVLSIDVSNAVPNQQNPPTDVFIFEEDNIQSSKMIPILRHGGSFKRVSINWTLTSVDEHGANKISPLSGMIVFEPEELEKIISFSVVDDKIPQEAFTYTFSLLPNTMSGQAELEGDIDVEVYIADSDDVYGVITIERGSRIVVDNQEHERSIVLTIVRLGGKVGQVDVTYSAYYLPRGVDEIRNSMPGIITEPSGVIILEDGIDSMDVILNIEDVAFLQTGASFEIRIESVQLSDRVPLISSHTPRLGENNKIELPVLEEYANSEVGFHNSSDLSVKEPTDEEGPLEITLEITREGLSSETIIQFSYRNEIVESKEVTRNVDYNPGAEQLELAPGQRSAFLTIAILPDDEPETDEILVIRMDRIEPDNQKLKKESSEKRIVILENDSPGGIFQFEDGTAEYFEIEENEAETVALTILRTEGDLAIRLVEYDVKPNGSEQFYGVPEIIVFEPGQRRVNISIVPKDDYLPELQQEYTLELHSYGSQPSELGEFRSVTISVNASDDPHGVFVMAEEDEDGLIPGREQNILESTESFNYSCIFTVHREMGSFGEATVWWRVVPNDTTDVYPVNGHVVFAESDVEGIITLQSLNDNEPESMEEFSIILYEASGGARVGWPRNASLIIDANDKAISFEGLSSVTVEEGNDLTIKLHRDGTGSDSTTVHYKTRMRSPSDDETRENQTSRDALPGVDFIPVPNDETPNSDLIFFPATKLEQTIKISVPDDNIPEDDEVFYVEMYDATGDYVVYGNTVLEVTILPNDNSSGVFHLSPPYTASLEEAVPYEFRISRQYGTFREVDVYWKIIADSDLDAGISINDALELQTGTVLDFDEDEGFVKFSEGDNEKSFFVTAEKDYIPEYKEDFVLLLKNVSGGSAQLSSDISTLMVNVSILKNDHPHGRMDVAESSRQVYLAEDIDNTEITVPSDIDVPSTEVNITIERTMGTDDDIKVMWEIYDKDLNITQLPRCEDLLLAGHIHGDVTFEPQNSRPNTGTLVYNLNPGFIETNQTDHPDLTELPDGFSFSLWIKPDLEKMFSRSTNSDASDQLEIILPLVSKYNETDSDTIYYLSLHLWGATPEDLQFAELQLIYRTTDTPGIRNMAAVELSDAENLFSADGEWTNIVINVNMTQVTVFFNTEIKGKSDVDVSSYHDIKGGTILIGAASKEQLESTFIGHMQDCRFYSGPLTQEQITQLFFLPAQTDVNPVSGVLEYREGENEKYIILQSVNDSYPEFNEEFHLLILDATNGAVAGSVNNTSNIIVLKSDNSNGLFGFHKSCEPEQIEEGGSVTCHVTRELGDEGYVTVHWKTKPHLEDDSIIEEIEDDFENKSGSLEFSPGQKEASFTLTIVDDSNPEITEKHDIILDSVMSHDDVISSASFSGASIDENYKTTSIWIKRGDNPYGVLQFAYDHSPLPSHQDEVPMTTEPLVVDVQEEEQTIGLAVVRAAGWHGDVTVEWRTRDGTAISSKAPKDFVAAAGTLNFKDGEGFKFVNITILDDEEPELEKIFFVDLLTPTGGVVLNGGSQAQIIIAPSDDAYGIYEFEPESRSVTVFEPQNESNDTTLKLTRKKGNLGQTVLKWEVKSDPEGDLGQQGGEVRFSIGQRSAEIKISVLADDIPEFDEHFTIHLLEVSHGVLGTGDSRFAIITVPANDEPYGVIVFKPRPVRVGEDDNNATLIVNRIGGTYGTIRIHYKTMDSVLLNETLQSTALPDIDFKAQHSSILMRENITTVNISIPILDDDLPETDESFYIQLTAVELLPSGGVPNSPRLGPDQDTVIRVVITENDSPHGVLVLSSNVKNVTEDWSEEEKVIVNVVRRFGTFGDITVGISTSPGSARPNEDYSLTNSEVTFLDGEDTKSVPVHIIDDVTPELAENFTIQLLTDSVTGGARVGDDNTCIVTIEKSDYPYGFLEISVIQSVVSEPEYGSSGTPVEFTVRRTGGLLEVVAVQWKASIDGMGDIEEDSGGGFESGEASGEDITDIDITSGTIYFVTDEAVKNFTIRVMPDDIPENEELVTVKLEYMLPGSKGDINPERNSATVRIPANDFPYGIVSLENSNYSVNEEENTETNVILKLHRSAGLFGTLRVVYSTQEVDLISEIVDNEVDIVSLYFEAPVTPTDQVTMNEMENVDVTTQTNPLVNCAEACLRQRSCEGFLYSVSAFECVWLTGTTDLTVEDPNVNLKSSRESRMMSNFMYYHKNSTGAGLLYDTQAKSGMDFMPITGASVLFQEGQSNAEIEVKVLDDDVPELDEYFQVILLSVSVQDMDAQEGNGPLIEGIRSSKVKINANDHPNGMFTIYSSAPGSKDDGKLLEAEERSQLSLEMVVERKGGSVGTVTVDCQVFSGTALRNMDFIGDDFTLKFDHGETKNVFSLSVIDDSTPELNEDFRVKLSSPTGGAVISNSMGEILVVILANDKVGGVVAFHQHSRAIIGDEGDDIRLDLVRSEPAKGGCDVRWTATTLSEGQSASDGLNATSGYIHFEPDSIASSFWLHLRRDDEPEIKEEYKITLSDPVSTGIPPTGSAALDPQGSVAVISIRGSNDPHGVFQFSETSQVAGAEESMGELELFVTRRFGSIGEVWVYFQIIPGTLSTLNPDIQVAEPGNDFTFSSDGFTQGLPFITFGDGVTTVPIVFTIIDDDTPELNEIFHVNLTKVELIRHPEGTLNVIPPSIDPEHSLSQVVIDANDGTKGRISFHPDSVNLTVHETEREDLNVTLQIIRERGTYGEVTFFIFPQNREAVLGEDYQCEATTLTLRDSQDTLSFTVTILDDTIPEGAESFEVLLGNPSAGLDLGNSTRSTITISSNDDAHGRLSFSNAPVIYLQEPDDESVKNSKAELIVSRSPEKGTFGQITVRYRVEPALLSSEDSGSSGTITDLYPIEGYVIIDDGVQNEVLEISAVSDEDPELDEEFIVTLFNPQNGATLADEGTVTRIVIHENDSPYGKFKIYPKGIRNGNVIPEIEEGPGVHILQFDVVREKGSQGNVVLGIRTEKGTAQPYIPSEKSPHMLCALQAFDAFQMKSFHSFSIGENQFLLALSTDRSGPLTTDIGSNGTVRTLMPGVHSTLYKFQGLFTPVQTVETDGASAAITFSTDIATYLFITNEGKFRRYETVSRLYIVDENGHLTVLDEVSTKGASDVTHFLSNQNHHLVVANSVDDNQISSIDSYVYRFDEGIQKLTLIQTLPTRGAAGVRSFTWNHDIYLAIANRLDSEMRDDSTVASSVYKWTINEEGRYSFTQRTPVDVSHSTAVEVVESEGSTFVIFSSVSFSQNEVSSDNPERIDIFKVMLGGPQHTMILQKHQTLKISHCTGLQTISVPPLMLDVFGLQKFHQLNKEVNLLAVASSNQSEILYFDSETETFERLLKAGPTTAMVPISTTSHYKNTTMVAVATTSDAFKIEGSYTEDGFINSVIKSGVYFISEGSENHHETGDYLPIMSNLVLEYEEGQMIHSVALTILDDDLPEERETLKIILSNGFDQRAEIDSGQGSLEINILASDDAHGVIGFAQDSLSKTVEETETDNHFTLNLVREKAAYGRVKIAWSTEGSLSDITPLQGEVTFEDGQDKAGIQVTVLADDLPEVEETVRVILNQVVDSGNERPHLGARLNSTTMVAVLKILPNDSPHGIVHWSATSLRVVISEPEKLSGASQLVTLQIIREQGKLGDIQVFYKTSLASNLPSKSQAMPGADFIPRDDSITMMENITIATVAISIVPDDIPEDIESFYVILTDVRIIGESKLDSKPGLGPPGTETAEITIDENDDARGFIQFNVTRNTEGAVEAFEMPGGNSTLKLPLVRLAGAFRSVGVEWVAQPKTAKGADFYPHKGSVHFEEDQRTSYIEIFIVDDDEVEFMETFNVGLSRTTGGAKRGGDVNVIVNILPNDSPSGMFGFLQTKKTVQESRSADDPNGKLEFGVRRFQGTNDDVILSWSLGPNALADLTPTSGKLEFGPGERIKKIVLRSLPDQVLEGDEDFKISLISATGGAEISPVAGVAEVTIEADEGAAGTVSIEPSFSNVLTAEPTDSYSGVSSIKLHRGPGYFGHCFIRWQIIPADANTFTGTEGEAEFEDLQNETEIIVTTVDDLLPEGPHEYTLRLMSATGGAEIDPESSTAQITVAASDSPHGTFTFSQPIYHVKEEGGNVTPGGAPVSTPHLGQTASGFSTVHPHLVSSIASLTILRNYGHLGEVAMTVLTVSGTATENEDFYSMSKKVVFTDGESFKIVDVEVLNDVIPEGPEQFFVNLTDVRILSHSRNDYTERGPNNISLDIPPTLGEVSVAIVQITKNDGAEGMIEFPADLNGIEVDESNGTVNLPIDRLNGHYGEVSVTLKTLDRTAERGKDYLAPSAGISVVFVDGQTTAYAAISIVDDAEMEMAEKFTVALAGVTGGARRGNHLLLEVTIKKSDYPNGLFHFMEGSNKVSVRNPPSGGTGSPMHFILERTGGNKGEVLVKWKIVRIGPYFGETMSSTPISEDISPPHGGAFQFGDGEGGQRDILITILPTSTDQEVEEKFAIVLEDTEPAEVSKTEGNVTITVLKKGHPNGIIKFVQTNDSDSTMKVVEEPDSGLRLVVFPVTRDGGTLGKVSVKWSIEEVAGNVGTDSDNDFKDYSGVLEFRDGQAESEVLLYVISDYKPELEEKFIVTLSETDGGAEIDRNHDQRELVINPNDSPHGVFAIYSMDQRVSVLTDESRAIIVNVTRQEGLFGRVVVSFDVKYDNPEEGVSYLITNTGQMHVPNGSPWEVTEVSISSNVFLAVGATFTIELTEVQYVDDGLTIPPRLSSQVKASATVPTAAGNPQVGFEPTVSKVYNSTRNACRVTMVRIGLYGDVTVHWASGYHDNSLGEDARQGQTMPSAGTVTMKDRQKQQNASLTLFPNSVEVEGFAVHITRVTSTVGGGARVLSNRDMTEIEPCGVVRFATYSQEVSVSEDSVQVTLTIQRLYGSRYEIDVIYSTSPVTAIPGRDYLPVTNGRIRMKNGEQDSQIHIQLMADELPEISKVFQVRITEASQLHDIYKGLSPRVLDDEAVSRITIKASDNAHGILGFETLEMTVSEQSIDGSNIVVVMVTVQRTVGTYGQVSVMVSTISGDESDLAISEPTREYLDTQEDRRATANSDYEVRQINITFEERQTEVQVPIVIIDDKEPEPRESFFIYLHSPTGGARIGDNDDGIMKIIILPNDFPNGRIGFALSDGLEIMEDSISRSLNVPVSRKYAYGNVTIAWRAVLEYPDERNRIEYRSRERVNLREQLQQTSGEIICPKEVLNCFITITLKDDQVAEFATWFLLELYKVSQEAGIDPERRFINITIADSDFPRGMFQFSLKSRLPVVSKRNKAVGLTVERIGGNKAESTVHFVTQELKRVIKIAGATLYPAISDVDYKEIQGKTVFKPGQKESFIMVPLHPELSSPNPLPQTFQVKLAYVKGDGDLDPNYSTANVTIVRHDGTKKAWRVYELLEQKLDAQVIEHVLAQLRSLVDDPMDSEQIVIFHATLSRIIDYAMDHKLPTATSERIYDLFCELLDPHRSDSVMGFTEFGETFEKFALSLLTEMDCKADDTGTVVYRNCPHAMLQSARWYPEVINGFTFVGKGKSTTDYFNIPIDLLDVHSTGVDSVNPTCYDIVFIEYMSQVWFSIPGEKGAMSNKAFSVSVKDQTMASMVSPVRYRIYTTDARISPKGAECVIWNQASMRWLNSPETCQVQHDTDNYVDCACHHMSVYAVRGPTDDLAGYNEATYVACFLCVVAASLTLLGHHVCARNMTFAAKLMMHMVFACGITQLLFVVSTLTSEEASPGSCSAIGILLHLFWISQFTWILVQTVNIWKVLVMNDDHTDQLYTIFFVVGWGLPAIIVVLHSVIMYALGYISIQDIYGDVHNNGDMCFIMDAKAGLLSAVAPAGLCIMATCLVGLQLYQRDRSWKQYDDMFRGRFNKIEIPLLFGFFFILSASWLFGGLHLAFGQMWMLVLFIFFDMIQGLYLLIIYGILHNQLVKPIKSTMEIAGGVLAATAYATSVVGSQAPSVSADVMNRSTQNLVSKDQDELDWGVGDAQFNRSRPIPRGNMDDSFPQDDSADFDDLMFALKSGISEPNLSRDRIVSAHSSPEKPSTLRTSQHSLDVIDDVTDDDDVHSSRSSPRQHPGSYPIADTHL